MIYLTK